MGHEGIYRRRAHSHRGRLGPDGPGRESDQPRIGARACRPPRASTKGAKSKVLNLSVSQPGPRFALQPGQKITVAVATQSSFDAKDPLPAAEEMARGLTAEKLGRLREQHARWWREFWAKSLVEIGDPLLEQRYYLSNYVLGSGSRDPEFPRAFSGSGLRMTICAGPGITILTTTTRPPSTACTRAITLSRLKPTTPPSWPSWIAAGLMQSIC